MRTTCIMTLHQERCQKSVRPEVRGTTEFYGGTYNNTKNGTMKELVKSKFTHNTELKTELLDTGDLIFAEAGVDTHFAIGLPLQNGDIFDSKKWKGQNYLGKILCEVRADLSI